MFGESKKTMFEKSTSTIIGEGIILEGALLTGTGAIRIDGKFSGNINIDGHVILGKTGIMTGDVKAESAMLAGKYDGNMTIKNALHLASTVVFNGHIETGKLIIDENAIFNGTCNTANPNSQVENTTKSEKSSQNESIPRFSPNTNESIAPFSPNKNKNRAKESQVDEN